MVIFLLLACTPSTPNDTATEKEVVYVEDTDVVLVPISSEAIETTITAYRDEEEAIFAPSQALYYERDGYLTILVTEASCTEASDYLTRVTGDPTNVIPPGECFLWFSFPYYEESEYHWTSLDYNNFDPTFNMYCAMDDGEWEHIGNDQYQYTGNHWQGHPLDWQASLTEDMDLGFQATYYEGNFIDSSIETSNAHGAVNGTIEGTYCENISGYYDLIGR